MSESIKFAGKNNSGNITPVSVTDTGEVKESRVFECEWTNINTEWLTSLDDTHRFFFKSVDCSKKGVVGVAVKNRTGRDITLEIIEPYETFDVDRNISLDDNNGRGSKGTGVHANDTYGGYPVANSKAESLTFIVPANTIIIITSDECPTLNYIKNLNVAIKVEQGSSAVATRSGTYVWAITKG